MDDNHNSVLPPGWGDAGYAAVGVACAQVRKMIAGDGVDHDTVHSQAVAELFLDLLPRWNAGHASRGGKSFGAVMEEALARGYAAVHPDSGDRLCLNVGDRTFTYEKTPSGYHLWIEEIRQSYRTNAWMRVSTDAARTVDFMEEFVREEQQLHKAVDAAVAEMLRDSLVSRISEPEVSLRIRRELFPKGVKAFVGTDGVDLILYVNVVKEVWFRGKVAAETAGVIFPMVPYVVSRPDDLKVLGGGFRIIHDYGGVLERGYLEFARRS